METKKKYLELLIGIILGVFISSMIGMIVYFAVRPPTSQEIFDNNINKAVEIRCSNDNETWGYATGCFIDSNGTILTNKHVVKSENAENAYSYIEIRLASSDDWISAALLDVSSASDLATLKVNLVNVEYFDIAKKVNNGEKIYTIGNPNGFGLSLLEGVVSSQLREVNVYGNIHKMMQTSFVINGGNSGGPVFNANGQLVGLMSFRIKNSMDEPLHGVSFAVPIDAIIEFLS